MNIPKLNLGKFDHITCSGVLHHLDDPDEGLAALESVLDDKGAMTIMVYGLYGRMAVYQIQEMMRLINLNAKNSQEKVDNCKTTIKSLFSQHWYHHSVPKDFEVPDIEIYDLYLHSQDRAYTIPQFYDFVEGAGLDIVKLFSYSESDGNALYNPAAYIKDQRLLSVVQGYSLKTQQAIAELMNGRISQQVCYAGRKLAKLPDTTCLSNIPFFTITAPRQVYELITELVRSSKDTVTLTQQRTKATVIFNKTKNAEAIFHFMDGKRTLGEIFNLVIADGNNEVTISALTNEFAEIFSVMNEHNWLLLRDESIPELATQDEMHRRTVFV